MAPGLSARTARCTVWSAYARPDAVPRCRSRVNDSTSRASGPLSFASGGLRSSHATRFGAQEASTPSSTSPKPRI